MIERSVAAPARGRMSLGRRIVLYAAALIFVVPAVIPFAWMLSTSIKPLDETFVSPPVWWPNRPTLAAYYKVLFESDLMLSAVNSLVIASLTTALALVLALNAGYGFARFRFFGRDLLAISVLFGQMLPNAVVLIPLYLYFDRLRLIDTYPALIISYLVIVLPLCTWMLRGYFLGLPREIEEAALIDGCSQLGVLFRVALPLALPAVVATGLFAFTVSWDEFLFALTFTQSPKTWTLPVRITSFSGEYYTDWSAVMAASALMSVPVVIIFLSFQRHFVRGLSEGAVKG